MIVRLAYVVGIIFALTVIPYWVGEFLMNVIHVSIVTMDSPITRHLGIWIFGLASTVTILGLTVMVFLIIRYIIKG